MKKFEQLAKIKEIYQSGENIIQYLKKNTPETKTTVEDVLISYDFQAGSYIKTFYTQPEYSEIKDKTCKYLAGIIENLGQFDSIIEVGVGEATTLCTLLKQLKKLPSKILGFDISWSRLKFANFFLEKSNFKNISLFTANLFEIPLPDNSVDIVYTAHSVEPNGGKEEEALKELYRITNQYLILLEPSYEFAEEQARKRMQEHGYVTNLYATAQKLGYKIIEHKLLEEQANPLNPTAIMIIEKQSSAQNNPDLSCPLTKTKLTLHSSSLLYSEESLLAYPVIENIPCLLKENAILATHLLTDCQAYIDKK